MKKFLLTCVFPLLLLFACEKGGMGNDDNDDDFSEDDLEESVENTGNTVSDIASENEEDHEEDTDYKWDTADVVSIVLNGSSATVGGSGATASGSTVTIKSSGTYSFSGTLTNGQIVVNTDDTNIVRLILNGVGITCQNSAPINIEKAEKAMVVLADNTTNYLTDGTTYSSDDDPNATLFSKSDLTIYGDGTLIIDANYNDGITSKDGLIIKSGTITVDAADDGIRGKDYLIVKDGNITLTTGGDGLKSDNDEDSDRGYIRVEKGTINISAGDDAIQAETDVMVSDGTFSLTAGGGSSKTATSTLSSKGIKAGVNLVIDSGTFTISTSDDAIHSNENLSINGGTFSISAGDDGIHADTSLGINGGTIDITKSYEGIESKVIKITDGDIHVTSSDDGLNVAGGKDSSGSGGWGGQGGFSSSSGNYYLYIDGGYIYVDAGGDGLDANGTIEMTAGTVIVNGPTSNNDGALDYDSGFKISGGFLVAAGSSGMAQAPGSGSSQYSLLMTFSSAKTAGTMVHIQDGSGNDILSFVPTKRFQSVAFSSPELEKGSAYDVYTGGSSSGTVADGLYSGGTYTAGTQIGSFTISGTVTKFNK